MIGREMNNKAVLFILLIGILLILSVFSASASGQHSEEYYWWVAGSGNWSTPENWEHMEWDPDIGDWVPVPGVPGLGDGVSILNGGEATISSGANVENAFVQNNSSVLSIVSGGSLAITDGLKVDLDGLFEQSGGQASARYENVGENGTGTFKQTGGTNTIHESFQIGFRSGSNGTYELSGNGQLSSPAGHVAYYGTGVFIQTGGTNTIQDWLAIGFDTGSNGTYELSSNGELSTYHSQVGRCGTGTFTQTGGSHEAGFDVSVGGDEGGYGTYNLHNGTLVTTYVHIGGINATGTFNQFGGELEAVAVFVGRGGDGDFIQTGGDVTVDAINIPGNPPGVTTAVGTYELFAGGNIYVAGFISIKGGGYFIMNGGTITISGDDLIAIKGGGSFIMNEGTIISSEDAYLTVEDGGSLTGPGTFNIEVVYQSKEIYGTNGDDSVDVIFEQNSLLVGGAYNVEQISPDEFSGCTQENLLESSAFDVTFNGDFADEFTICIPYDEAEVAALNADEMNLQILHEIVPGTCESLEDVQVDTIENVVYGRADSFGKFAVFADETVPPEDLDIDWISMTSYKKHVDGTPISHPWRFETWVDLVNPGDLDHIDVTGSSVSFVMTQNGPNSWGYNSPAGYLYLLDLRSVYSEGSYTLEFRNISNVLLNTIILEYSLLPPEPLNPVNFTYPATNGATIIDTNPTYTWTLDSDDEDALMLLLQDVVADAEIYYDVPVSITTTSWSPGPLLPDREYEFEVSVLNVKDWEGEPAFPTTTADGDEFQYSLMIEYLNMITFTTELSPTEQIEETLDCVDESLADETLVGDGAGKSAEKRPNALRNMLERAAELIDDGLYDEACEQLRAAYKKCDGDPKPPDFVTGEAVEELAVMIQGIIQSLGCE